MQRSVNSLKQIKLKVNSTKKVLFYFLVENLERF